MSTNTTDNSGKRVLLAAPRGYCAGVDRAVVAVEQALDLYGAPVYVRKQIVHNKHVVATLEKRGAIFVDEKLLSADAPAFVEAKLPDVDAVGTARIGTGRSNNLPHAAELV